MTADGSQSNAEIIRNITVIVGFVVGGLVGFSLAFVRTRAAARQGRAAIGGYITDRYSKAVEQLGNSDSLHVRLGGIYALAHVGRDNARYRDTVLDVLCAFIRTHKPEGIGPDNEWIEKVDAEAVKDVGEADAATEKGARRDDPPAPPDVRAALDVVVELNPETRRAKRRRSRLYRMVEAIPFRFRTTLSWVVKRVGQMGHRVDAWLINRWSRRQVDRPFDDLYSRTLDLRGAYLVGIEKSRVFLGNAIFLGSRLERADFAGAHLDRASFWCADLEWAGFRGAHLEWAYFTGAHLGGAEFRGAHLEMAYFEAADLSTAKGLTQAHVDSFYGDDETKLPIGLERTFYRRGAPKELIPSA